MKNNIIENLELTAKNDYCKELEELTPQSFTFASAKQ